MRVIFGVPIVFIRENYKDDIGLHKHEYMHGIQHITLMAFWITLFFILGFANSLFWTVAPFGIVLHSAIYSLFSEYRLYCEVECYKEQLKYSPDNINLFAKYIAEDYKLDITHQEAKKLLED